MSTARVESLPPEPAHHHIVRRTVEACRLAKDAAGAAAEGIATGSAPLLNSLRNRERELDTLEAQIAPVDAEVNASQYTLAVLLGEYPESIVHELSTPTLIPSMPAPVAPGAPLDLLKRRPDIHRR